MPTQEGVTTPDDVDTIDSLNAWWTAIVAQLLAVSPVKKVTNLTALNGMVGASNPNGILAAVLTSGDGLERGSLWLRVADRWALLAGARMTEGATFISTLGSLTNLITLPGTSYIDMATSEIGAFVDFSAGTRILAGQAWVPFATSGSTEYASFGYHPAFKLQAGGAKLRGIVKLTTGDFAVDSILAVLPEEARPGATVFFDVPGDGNAIGRLRITDDGQVVLKTLVNADLGSNWYSLDGITIPQLNT